MVSELLDAFATIGFCTLVHHGLSSDLIAKAFRASTTFFELSTEAKLKYKYKTPLSNRGYIPYGAEKHDKDKEGRPLVPTLAGIATATANDICKTTTAPDQKETMDIGYDDPNSNSNIYSDGENNNNENAFKNEWPQELPRCDFRDVLECYFEEMDGLYLRLMKYIGKGLGLPDEGDYLVQKCDEKHENLRLLHYPRTVTTCTRTQQHMGTAIEEDGIDDDDDTTNANINATIRGNAHTDFGTLTLLVQDNVGGLKVKRKDGTWIDVRPVEDSIVVNVGDMLMRWSNDRLKATLHKVESPPEATTTTTTTTSEGSSSTTTTKTIVVPERYSIAFFCNANKNVEIKNFFTMEPARYPPINAHEYLTQRLAATIQTT